MSVIKLSPCIKDYLWGGSFFQTYGKGKDRTKVAECWELSFNQGNECYDSLTRKKITDLVNKKDIGPIQDLFPFFPILIKLIDAKENLSVQVHPSDAYALKNEGQFGKEEMWHILSCEKDAGIYVGFNKDYQKEDIYNSLKEGTILSKLNFFKVKPGQTFLIEPGTIHAIGKGVRLIEIQQNSTLTYRLYDYLRKDENGQYRELHIDKAINVLNYHKYRQKENHSTSLAKCKYFTVNRKIVDSGMIIKSGPKSFKSLTFIKGQGTINNIPYSIYDTFFIPFSEEAKIVGDGEFIETYIEEN